MLLFVLGKYLRSGIAGSCGRYRFNLLKNCWTIFQHSRTILPSHQQWVGVPVAPYLCQHSIWLVCFENSGIPNLYSVVFHCGSNLPIPNDWWCQAYFVSIYQSCAIHISSLVNICSNLLSICFIWFGLFLEFIRGFFLFFCFFKLLQLLHVEVPRQSVKLELQLPAYTTAIALPDLSRTWDLHHSLWQHQILNPLSEARPWTHIHMDTVGLLTCWATRETLRVLK